MGIQFGRRLILRRRFFLFPAGEISASQNDVGHGVRRRDMHRFFRLEHRVVRTAGIKVENHQVDSQHGILGAKGQGLGEFRARQALIIRSRQSAVFNLRSVGRVAQRPCHRPQGVMRVGVRGIELRSGLQFAEGLSQTAFLAQGQTQTAMRRLHFRLHIDGLAESLFRPRRVVPGHTIEPSQDEVRRFF